MPCWVWLIGGVLLAGAWMFVWALLAAAKRGDRMTERLRDIPPDRRTDLIGEHDPIRLIGPIIPVHWPPEPPTPADCICKPDPNAFHWHPEGWQRCIDCIEPTCPHHGYEPT